MVARLRDQGRRGGFHGRPGQGRRHTLLAVVPSQVGGILLTHQGKTLPVFLCRFTPLTTGLPSKKRVFSPSTCPTGIARRSNSPPSPVTAYLGENFSVRLCQFFKLRSLVTDNQKYGLVHTEFHPFRTLHKMSLSDSAKKLRDLPNAGGSSVVSEVLSFELLKRCFGATLLKTEMEVSYWPEGGSITDYTCQMFGTTLGVSVTRAMKFAGEFTAEDADKLLNKKLNGVVQSSANTLEKWSKQILHIWATSHHVANVVTATYDHLTSNVKSNTVLLVTVANNAHEIFANTKKR